MLNKWSNVRSVYSHHHLGGAISIPNVSNTVLSIAHKLLLTFIFNPKLLKPLFGKIYNFIFFVPNLMDFMF